MPNKLLLLIVVILVPIAVISFKKNETNFNLSENKNLKVTVRLKNVDNNEITNIDLEEYIIGVVAAEMPASFSIEALKAQAVAARTYAYYKIKQNKKEYDLVADITNQGYLTKEEMQEKWKLDYDKYYNKISSAVNSTNKEILTYNGQVIKAYYFAMSNGYTENAITVFNEVEPYLASVESSWDNENVHNFEVTSNLSKEKFCSLLKINCSNIIVSNIKKNSSNRVESLTINQKEFKGTDIREKLNLRSTDFIIEINTDVINITTYGYGHGVGMSQYGANGMAKEGYSYEEILKYFYQDVEISKI